VEKANVFTGMAVEKYSCCDICLNPPQSSRRPVALKTYSRLIKSVACTKYETNTAIARKVPCRPGILYQPTNPYSESQNIHCATLSLCMEMVLFYASTNPTFLCSSKFRFLFCILPYISCVSTKRPT
jgi:hypothetical protein